MEKTGNDQMKMEMAKTYMEETPEHHKRGINLKPPGQDGDEVGHG